MQPSVPSWQAGPAVDVYKSLGSITHRKTVYFGPMEANTGEVHQVIPSKAQPPMFSLFLSTQQAM